MGKLAIKGGSPVRDARVKPWPSWPIFGEEERRNLLKVFESGKWWYGEKVKEFEQAFALFQDAKYGVSCTNGTAALEIGLLSCGIGAGAEVIVPPYTFVATASSVLKVNAVPVFADIEIETGNLDPVDVERKITEKTKAIVPVHLGGLPCDMDAFNTLSRKYKLKIIEDACHSWGSKWKGKGTGALGDCGAFSFQMSKNITSGEGGILLTDNEELADTARSYSNCGRGKTGGWYEHFLLGSNLRMTELQAAILLGQLTRLEQQTLKRAENAGYLNEKLKDLSGIKVVPLDKRVTRRSYHLYIFRFIQEEWGITRQEFISAVSQEGVPVGAGYTPLYKNPLFQNKGTGPKRCPVSCPYYGTEMDYSSVYCKNAEKLSEQAIWISQSVFLSEREDMKDIVKAIEKVWSNRKELSSC